MRARFSWLGLAAASACLAQTPVILISVDTLRADRLDRMPHVLAWASNGGTVFRNAESQIPLTLPSHTVLMTSTLPFENGVESNAGHVPESALTLASVLKGRGYSTAAFIGGIFLERELGLDRGFDTYDSPFSFGAISKLSGELLYGGAGRNVYSARDRRPGALVIHAANQWMAGQSGRPVFVFIHLFDVHKPWRLGSYDAEVAGVDALLGSFEQTLRERGWWDRSLVILTSDHGEGLGDHGESDHGYFVYESTLHVPLVAHWPAGGVKSPAVVEQPLGLVDVAPTILEALGIPRPAAFHGRSILDRSAREVFSESVYARDAFGWAALRAIRSGGLKYIDAPRAELYGDASERVNLVASKPAEAARLKAALARFAPVAPASNADPSRKAVLESLGYLAPGPRSGGGKGVADPKDKLPELIAYEEALDLMAARRYPQAATKLRAILAGDPGNLLARRDLGAALVENRDYSEAVGELRRVAAAAPDDFVTRFELGLAYEHAGRAAEARSEFEAACRIAPGAAQCREKPARAGR